jgi:hypothetical protein
VLRKVGSELAAIEKLGHGSHRPSSVAALNVAQVNATVAEGARRRVSGDWDFNQVMGGWRQIRSANPRGRSPVSRSPQNDATR